MATKLDFRVAPVLNLRSVLEDAGQDASAVFATAAVDERLFEHADNRIELADLGRLLRVAADTIKRNDLGLLLAKTCGPETLGALLPIASAAPDLRTCLRNIVGLLHYHDRAGFLSLSEADDFAVLKYELRDPDVEGVDIIISGAIGIAHQVMLAFCGKNYHPEEVRLSMGRPRNAWSFKAYFGAPVSFGCAEDALVFSKDWLQIPMVSRPQTPEVRELKHTVSWDLTDHVRHQIAIRLGQEAISAQHVAKALGLSRRSLDRQLATLGTTYGQLLNEVRLTRAKRLLAAGSVPVSDICLALGYANPSAFSRAFQEWCGMSPMVWRKVHGSSGKAC